MLSNVVALAKGCSTDRVPGINLPPKLLECSEELATAVGGPWSDASNDKGKRKAVSSSGQSQLNKRHRREVLDLVGGLPSGQNASMSVAKSVFGQLCTLVPFYDYDGMEHENPKDAAVHEPLPELVGMEVERKTSPRPAPLPHDDSGCEEVPQVGGTESDLPEMQDQLEVKFMNSEELVGNSNADVAKQLLAAMTEMA